MKWRFSAPLLTFFAGKEVKMPVGFFSRGGKVTAHLVADRHRVNPLQGFMRDEKIVGLRRHQLVIATKRANAVKQLELGEVG